MKRRNSKKSNAGFTLVELIVVIAIMAILAGVGTVGYSAYIKSANKGADKTLVGNIMRAIETGVYSTAFELDESMTLAEISYPVGFAVVNTDGTSIYKSGSTITENDNSECHFEEVTVYCIEDSTYTCTHGKTNDTYKVTEEKKTICTQHSTVTSSEKIYPIEYGSCSISWSGHKWNKYTKSDSVPADSYINDDIYIASSYDSTICEYAYANKYNISTDKDGNKTVEDTTGPIYNALEAAFGSLDNMKLSYDGWTNDEGITNSTIYNQGEALFTSIKNQATNLINKSNNIIVGSMVKSFLSDDYKDAGEMLSCFSEYFSAKYKGKEEEWLEDWKAAKTGTISYTFGMTESDKYHHDFVYAATTAYNAAFVSYLVANGIDSNLASLIENWTTLPDTTEVADFDLSGMMQLFKMDFIPKVVNNDALAGKSTQSDTDGTYNLINTFVNGAQSITKPNSTDKYSKTEAEAIFAQIKNLYTQYTSTSACEENGKAIYDMLVTVDATSDMASASGSTDDYFDYYKNYLAEISNIYNAATAAAKDGNIVIMIYVKNGSVECEVYPSAANPRND